MHHVATARFHFALAVSHATRDPDDPVTIDAISMRILAGIEGLAAMSEATRADLVGDMWPDIRGMRNRIAHGYATVEPKFILKTAHEDLPELIRRLDAFTAH